MWSGRARQSQSEVAHGFGLIQVSVAGEEKLGTPGVIWRADEMLLRMRAGFVEPHARMCM